METLREKTGIIGGILMAIINGLAGLGMILPQGVDAEGVALLNGAVLAVGLLIAHFVKPKPAPVEPIV